MSDSDYASFLDKANQDTGAATKTSSKSQKGETKATNTEVPSELGKIDAYYTSEADEPFEVVSLRWEEGVLPSTDDFKELVGHGGYVEELGVKEFDPKGEYKEVVDAVKKAGSGEGKGKVKVFRIEHGSTRAEYYVVSVDGEGRRVVGLKAKAVES